jgi:hypothetical protein
MRIIWSLLLLPLFSFYSPASSAAEYSWYGRDGDGYSGSGASPSAACSDLISKRNAWEKQNNNSFRTYSIGGITKQSETTFRCSVKYTWNSGSATYPVDFNRSGTSCPSGQVYDSTTGECKLDDPLNCAAKEGQPTNWRAEFASRDAYDQNRIICNTSQGGCGVDVCSGAAYTCQTEGRTGKFVCTGDGVYTGDPQAPSSGEGVDGCEGPLCEPSPPQTSSSDKSCTTPAVVEGVTTYTCVTENNSNQWADSDCAVGEFNGVQGLHCTSPDYVPESNDMTRTDNVTESNNPDGGKTTTTESQTDQTKCKAGNCSSTSTTTTTTTTTNGNGQTTGESSTCTGDRCDDPSTPGKDESEEEPEEEQPVERTVSGDACSSSLSCEGDAIDCAILRQQKAMRCSLDWDTQKGAVIAEAGRAEYQLQTEEIDASSLFSGPSASRWLSPSCPADRSIYLTLTDSSITFSWSFVCQYASALGNLLVALASLFFAVYVGRAFGGD